MKVITIYTLPSTPAGTQGLLVREDGVAICLSMERPWADNKPMISCIPRREYRIKRRGPTQKIPYTHFAILDVPNREGCAIHRANAALQLEGCVALGEQFEPCIGIKGIPDGTPGVMDSKHGFDEFMAYMGSDDEGTLVLKEIK